MCLNLVTPSVWLWVKIARGLTHSLQPIPNSQFLPTSGKARQTEKRDEQELPKTLQTMDNSIIFLCLLRRLSLARSVLARLN